MSKITSILQTSIIKLPNGKKTLTNNSQIGLIKITETVKKESKLPIVSIPIVAYAVNKTKLAGELGKSYHPYTTNLKNAKEEFSKRGLPWNDSYADGNSGNLNITGTGIIDKYDTNKQNFSDAGLTFNNNLVNSSTGELNSRGQTIWNNYTNTVDELNDAHIRYDSRFFNKSTGKLTELKQKELGFKASPQDALESDYGFESGEIESPEIHDIDILADTELSDSLDQLAEIADNPVLEGVVAEMLPGTRFLKPGKDFIEGDYEKATVGTLSRAGEILLAPVKIGWSLFGAVAGSVSWLAGNRGEGTGPIGGFKQASHMWARSRNKVENFIIDREEKDPNEQQAQISRAYEAATQREVDYMRKKTDQEVQEIINSHEDENRKAEKERQKAEKERQKRHKETSKIRERAYSRINQNNANQEYSRQNLREIIADRERNFKEQQQAIARLSKEIKLAEEECNTTLKNELEKQKAELEKIFKAQSDAALASIKEILDIVKQYEVIYQKNNAEGFGSIAGYEETKKQLAAMFGTPLLQNKKNPEI